jgi:Tol biopolymer transport system component
MDYSPSISADGKWVIFTSERDGSADIYRVHLDGSGVERLTDDPAYDDQAVLSPDGKTLAFVSSRGTGRARIWLLDLASRRAHLLTSSSSSDFRPAWSPDGKWIAYSSDRDSNAGHLPGRWELLQSVSIYVIRPDGSDPRRVTRGRGVAGSPRWSPDGKRIYYTSGRSHSECIVGKPDLTGLWKGSLSSTQNRPSSSAIAVVAHS